MTCTPIAPPSTSPVGATEPRTACLPGIRSSRCRAWDYGDMFMSTPDSLTASSGTDHGNTVPADALKPGSTVASKVARASWYALAIMTLINACHFLDRTMISIIVEPVRAEFGLHDSQIGLLTGLAYGATFALAGIPIGLLVDRVNRVRLLAGLVFIWSGMTVLAGFAQSFHHLLLTRMGVGAAEAGGSPTSMSLIGDLFPPNKRSTAVGYFFLATGIGALASFLIGGFVSAHYGWRAAMMVAGIPGVLLAFITLLTVRHPVRGANDPTMGVVNRESAGIWDVLRHAFANPAMRNLLLGVCFAAGGVSTIAAWLPSYMMRFHGFSLKEAGFSAAIAGGLFSSLGSLAGGFLSDRLANTAVRRRMDLSAAACLVAVLLAMCGLWSTSEYAALGALCLTMFCIFVVFPAAFGTMLGITAPQMRGTTSATLQIVSNFVGYGVGPFAVGWLSDFYGGSQSLRLAMMTGGGVSLVLAAVTFALSARACGRRFGTRAP
ncbi:hypothetical protein DBB29_01265 [Pandoraea cepalis]|uniref:Major facilitator superfamily (MFS) profile domain-containing protein n=2 Tax=Burkholderiaceae TaxID=119060 RepID=A0AAW7MHB3_9BURK|nr:hypothetical protein [Pandoraea cepalis]MDN4576760.1 hypothetical protein [Pandoraea cepalis]